MSADKDFEQKYNAGFFAAATRQHQLFEELRDGGVIGLITQKTGRRFFGPRPPLTKEQLESKILVWGIEPTEERIAEAFSHLPWEVEVVSPELRKNGKWEDLLKIIASRSHREYRGGEMVTLRIDRVQFAYSPRQQLQIQGERRVFNGKLVIPAEDPQTAKLKVAIDQVFDKPKIEIPPPRRTTVWGSVIRLGATG